MTNKKANVLMIIGAFVLIGLIGGFAIAFFNYTRTGSPNNITTGRIVFNSSQYETIHLTNVFPIASSEAASLTDNAISVTVSGDTTYVDGEEFLISLVEVNNVVNGKEIPINYTATYEAATGKTIGASSNNYWSARESKDASIYLLNSEGIVEEDAQVLVGYIDNGATGIEGILTIKAYVDASRIAVSDTLDYGPIVATGYDNGTTAAWVNGRTVLTTEEWNSLQGNSSLSFKIKAESNEGIWVSGGPTPETCFTTNVLSEQDHTVEITGYNGGATYAYVPNPTQQQVSQCVTYFENAWGNGEDDLDEGETWETFCDGTGTYWGDTFEDHVINDWFGGSDYAYLVSLGMISKIVDATCGINVEIPRTINGYTVTKIADGTYSSSAFKGKFINKVVIPNTVTTIGNYAFYTSGLSKVTIPNSVTSIGNGAFQVNQLTNVNIPNSVTSMGVSAFATNQLTNVTISNGLTTLNQSVFGANQLTSIVIPNSVTTIESNAFSSNKLTSIKIPNSVTTIKSNAFKNNKLTKIEIPSSVISIEYGVFNNNNLPNSEAFIYKRTDTNHDGIAEIDLTTVIGYGGANKNVIIPSGVTTLGLESFAGNKLTSVTIPDSVTKIEQGAFTYNNLTSISISSNITSIGMYAFNKGLSSNPNLTTITIDKSCSDIKNNLKVGTKNYYPWLALNSPYIASGVTIIGANNEVCDTY